jgi:colanic acid biosynthesis glycosyl transferase WcaI
MNILVISQYYWPENFRIGDVCLALKERGHNVTVLTGKPNYPNGRFYTGYNWFKKNIEVWNNMKIYRSNLILRGDGGGVRMSLNYISFAILASIKVLFIKEKIDKILVYAPSPITVGIPAYVAKLKFKALSFFWVHDLWPESIRVAGGIENKSILNSIERLTKFIYDKSDHILVQSKGFISYIENQGIQRKKITYYPFYAEAFYNVRTPEKDYLSKFPDGFNIVFAGNIGEVQSFQTLIQAAILIQKLKLKINWIIFGDGKLKQEVNNLIKENSLENSFILKGSFPAEEMPKYFACADALIVSLKKNEIFTLTIPGKLQSYLACGRPIIGSLDGVGSDIITEANAGFVAKSESPEELVNAITKIYEMDQDERDILGLNARSYYENEFERERLIEKLERILENNVD